MMVLRSFLLSRRLRPEKLYLKGVTCNNYSPSGIVSGFSTKVDGGNVAEVLAGYDTFLLDCDGVIWRTDHVTPIEGVAGALKRLTSLGKRLLYVTNNSRYATASYLEKCRKYGFSVRGDQLFCVAYASAVYIRDIAKVSGPVYVVGSAGLGKELGDAGIDYFGVGPDPDGVPGTVEDMLCMDFRDDVGAVLVSFDEHFSYNKIYKAASYLLDESCLYLATNSVEMSSVIGPGRRRPATGVMVAAVSAAANRQPLVIGKPSSYFFDCILQKHPDVASKRTLFIGDNINTDIGFANNVGIDSALVLTGASSLESLAAMKDGNKPKYYLDSLSLFANV